MLYPRSKLTMLRSMIDRAEALLVDLEKIYLGDLASKSVSAEAVNITHEVIEKCSNILDSTMNLLYESEIKPKIEVPPKRSGYFPSARDEHGYRSALGQWNITDLESIAPGVDARLRALQPYSDVENEVLSRLRKLAAKKHTGLEPQRRRERVQVNAASPQGGRVSWNPAAVRFGPGVSILGVPVSPMTQMPISRQDIEIDVEVWVSFHFEDDGENALEFCKAAVAATRRAVSVMLNESV